MCTFTHFVLFIPSGRSQQQGSTYITLSHVGIFFLTDWSYVQVFADDLVILIIEKVLNKLSDRANTKIGEVAIGSLYANKKGFPGKITVVLFRNKRKLDNPKATIIGVKTISLARRLLEFILDSKLSSNEHISQANGKASRVL